MSEGKGKVYNYVSGREKGRERKEAASVIFLRTLKSKTHSNPKAYRLRKKEKKGVEKGIKKWREFKKDRGFFYLKEK